MNILVSGSLQTRTNVLAKTNHTTIAMCCTVFVLLLLIAVWSVPIIASYVFV